jgi:hypothetical protein
MARVGVSEEFIEPLVHGVDGIGPPAARLAAMPLAEERRPVPERLERLGDRGFLGRQVFMVVGETRM